MIDGEALFEEFSYCLRQRDGIKMTLVLEALPEVSSEVCERVLDAAGRSRDTMVMTAITELQSRKPEMFDRLPKLKELYVSLLIDSPEEIIKQLKNGAVNDKSTVLTAVKYLQIREAAEIIEEQLQESPESLWARAAIEILGEFGMQSSVPVLSRFLYAKDRSLIGTAIRALGNIATPSAIERLTESTGNDAGRDVLVIRELARLELPLAIEKMVGMLCSHHTQLRNYAKEKIAEIGSKAVPYLLKVLVSRDADWTIHALNLLAQIGDQTAGTEIRKLLQSMPENPNVRFAAYEALEVIKVGAGGYTLTEGLVDKDDHVAFAAARAINANLSEAMINGLKSLVTSDNKARNGYLAVLLNAETDKVIKELVRDDGIRDATLAILNDPGTADDTHRHFIVMFSEWGYANEVDILKKRHYTGKSHGKELWTVDDSKMVLLIYKKVLGRVNCLLRQFDGGAAVLDAIGKKRPALLFTDLNMPGINGIDLIRSLRKTWSKEQLPVILVTTQSDVRNDDAFDREGINEIIEKPFSAEKLLSVAEKYLNV